MKLVMTILAIVALFFLFVYLFEIGVIVKSNKVAVKYVGRNRAKKASYIACTGQVARILKVKDTKVYDFSLDLNQKKGTLEVIVNDWGGHPLMILSEKNPTGRITLNGGVKYKLVFWFRDATGSYELDWN